MSVWKRTRLRRVVTIVGGSTPTPAPEHWGGDIPFFTPPDLRPVHGSVVTETGRTLTDLGVVTGSTSVRAGSVILSKRAPIGYVARLGVGGAFNQGCLVLEPDPTQLDAGFLTYLLSVRSEELNVLGRGTTFVELSASDLADIEVTLPPLVEQRAIADYLDRETAQIDTLIAKQVQLIATLRERRAAVRETAVSAMATSGPRLKHIVLSVRQGWSPQCYAWPADGVTTWAVLKAGAANGGIFRPSENKELPVEEDPRPEVVVRDGDLVVSRANTRDLVGSAAVVEGEYPRLMLCDKLYAFTLDRSRAIPRFVAMVLGSRRWRDLIELEATGASYSMLNISQSDIVNLPMPVPSLDEQRVILRRVDEQTAKIDALIAKTERFIQLSQERRTALITAAVTGQIDVRASA